MLAVVGNGHGFLSLRLRWSRLACGQARLDPDCLLSVGSNGKTEWTLSTQTLSDSIDNGGEGGINYVAARLRWSRLACGQARLKPDCLFSVGSNGKTEWTQSDHMSS